jgi:hypothetical protein
MQNADIRMTSAGRCRTQAARDASGRATWPPAVGFSPATRWRSNARTRAGSRTHPRGKPHAPATWRAVAGSRPGADARAGGRAGRPAGTRGAPGLVTRCRLAGSAGWPRFARGFFLFSSGSATQTPVQGRFDPLEAGFSPGSFFHRLPCRVEHWSRAPTTQGRSVWPKKEGIFPYKERRSSTLPSFLSCK